jgi:hypothetical protein
LGKENQLLRKLDPPTNTLVSNDESAMNFLGSQNKKNVGKRRLRPQVLLRIYRLSVKMWAYTRISGALARKAIPS